MRHQLSLILFIIYIKRILHAYSMEGGLFPLVIYIQSDHPRSSVNNTNPSDVTVINKLFSSAINLISGNRANCFIVIAQHNPQYQVIINRFTAGAIKACRSSVIIS